MSDKMTVDEEMKKKGVLTREQILINLFNEQHDHLTRLQIDERTAQRMVLNKGSEMKNEGQELLGKSQFQIQKKKFILSVIFDELTDELKGNDHE